MSEQDRKESEAERWHGILNGDVKRFRAASERLGIWQSKNTTKWLRAILHRNYEESPDFELIYT